MNDKEEAAAAFSVFIVNSDNELQRFIRLSAFEGWMAADKGRGLFLYDGASQFIAKQASDDPVAAIITQWCSEARRHVAIIRKFRRKLLILERSALNDPRCQEVFKVAFPSQKPPAAFASSSAADATNANRHSRLALLASMADPEIRNLMAELEANTSVGPVFDRNDVHGAIDEIAKYYRTGADRLERELVETQRKAERELAEIQQNAKRELAELRKKTEGLEKELKSHQAAVADSESSKSILLQKIVELQQNLASLELKKELFNQQKIAAEKKLADNMAAYHNEREQILHSTSWRMTAPLRSAVSIFKR